MALTRTLAQLRDAVQRTADIVQFTDKHPDSYVNDLVNRGLGALSLLCRTVDPEFQPIASTTLTCDGSNTTYALPSNFRSLISVEYTHDGFKTWLEPYQLHERASLTTPDVQANATTATGYKVIGTNLELLPLPSEDDTALCWYATNVTQLSADASTVDVMDRLDSYVIWWAAREVAQERENWERYDRLSASMAALEGDIRILARSKDLSAPGRPTDTRYASGRGPDRYGRTRRSW